MPEEKKTIRDAAKRHPAPDPLPLRDAAPDIVQLRVPVETGIDHNNVYLVREKDGWLVFDTGTDSPAVRAIWAAVLAGPLADGIRRIVVSHHHPDHLGLAAWLQDATGADVFVRPEELEAAGAAALRDPASETAFRDHFVRNGMPAQDVDRFIGGFMRPFFACDIPARTRSLEPGERLAAGRYAFEVLVLGGHSVAQLALHDPAAGILLSGDQMLETITPNVGLWPFGDPAPLANCFRSLDALEARDIRLVLPGHGPAHRTDGRRPEALRTHHRARLAALRGALRAGMTGFELSEAVFGRFLDVDNRMLALMETLAHLQWLCDAGEVVRRDGPQAWRYERAIR